MKLQLEIVIAAFATRSMAMAVSIPSAEGAGT
jgi:hypothetical protein